MDKSIMLQYRRKWTLVESEGPVRGHVTVQLCNEARQDHH